MFNLRHHDLITFSETKDCVRLDDEGNPTDEPLDEKRRPVELTM